MNLEQQVSNKEFSLRLRDLGVKQESLYYWEKNCSRSNDEWCISARAWHDSLTGEWGDCHLLAESENCSAFTVPELEQQSHGLRSEPEPWWDSDRKKYLYYSGGKHSYTDTLADAFAGRMIYLIENHLITLIK